VGAMAARCVHVGSGGPSPERGGRRPSAAAGGRRIRDARARGGTRCDVGASRHRGLPSTRRVVGVAVRAPGDRGGHRIGPSTVRPHRDRVRRQFVGAGSRWSCRTVAAGLRTRRAPAQHTRHGAPTLPYPTSPDPRRGGAHPWRAGDGAAAAPDSTCSTAGPTNSIESATVAAAVAAILAAVDPVGDDGRGSDDGGGAGNGCSDDPSAGTTCGTQWHDQAPSASIDAAIAWMGMRPLATS
jgi:hypothetical protein